jgi:hypothetical protein
MLIPHGPAPPGMPPKPPPKSSVSPPSAPVNFGRAQPTGQALRCHQEADGS